MIKNIIKTGFNIKVFDVDTKITKTLDKNKIISVIPDTKNVASVFYNEYGINQFLNPWTLIIDMSTIVSASSIKIEKNSIKKYWIYWCTCK